MQNNTIITSARDFNINQTLQCGQLFRYRILDNSAEVYTLDKKAVLHQSGDNIIIENEDKAYFENYFDLQCDYGEVKRQLQPLPLMKSAIRYGYGIRILRQDIVETIISFIISANNNIPRIQGILGKIAPKGVFPTLEELCQYTEADFKAMGCGYRASYLTKTIKSIAQNNINLSAPLQMDGLRANEFLCNCLAGVGPKVADCILLFAYHKMDVFPVDTWVKKVYFQLFGDEPSTKVIRKKLLDTYGDLSGYAQQYLFYSKRDGNKELI